MPLGVGTRPRLQVTSLCRVVLGSRRVSEPEAKGSLRRLHHHSHPCLLITGLRVCLCEETDSHSWLLQELDECV